MEISQGLCEHQKTGQKSDHSLLHAAWRRETFAIGMHRHICPLGGQILPHSNTSQSSCQHPVQARISLAGDFLPCTVLKKKTLRAERWEF